MPRHDNRHGASRRHHRAAAHRSRHATYRRGEEDSQPFDEVVKRPGKTTQRRGAPRSRAPYQHEQDTDDSDDYPRLAYLENDHASRRNPSTPSAASGANSARGRGAPHRSQTPRGHTTSALPSTQLASSSSRRRNNNDVGGSGVRRSKRATGLVESPADVTTLDDYQTPIRRRRDDGRYVYDDGNGYNANAPPQRGHHGKRAAGTGAGAGGDNVREPLRHHRPMSGSLLGDESTNIDVPVDVSETSSQTGPFHFRVRVHECRNAFDDLRDTHRAAPAVYFAIHTAEKRGHTGVSAGGGVYDPVFNDEFIFTSADPEHDALVCTLVAVATPSQRRDKKVAECVLSLHKLAWQVERMVWVPLVRHPGTEQAHEQGEVRVSIFSEDYGYDEVAPEEEEMACSTAVHTTLLRYAPKELHRLDWLTAAYVDKGPEGWKQLEALYRARTMEPVPVKMMLRRVEGLMDDAGRPVGACDVYVVVDDGLTEQQSRMAAYRHRATFNQDFHMMLVDPETDTMNVTVFGNGHKLGEAVVGLTNVQASVAKEVTLMLVRAAETGDASNGGQVVLTLLTEEYNSPHPMTAAQEAKLRNRVRNYLWCYLRDDLHRLDAIVGSIDNEDVYMKEWTHTIGPERTPKLLLINVREATNIGAENNGMVPRCYVRVCVGPETQRTELAVSRNGCVAFKNPLHVHVYDPASDAVEVMLVADSDDGEKEISRVTFGVGNLPRGQRVPRTLHLVADALKRTAHVQGEVAVELMAEDFGNSGANAKAAMTKIYSASSTHMQRLEGITQRSSPEKLHRVPFILDTATPDEAERVVKDEAKQHGTDVAVAPMTVKIVGVRDFKPATNFYVKVYLNKEPILRTRDLKGGKEVTLNIDDNNERTLRLGNAAQSVMTFKVARHRSVLKGVVLGEAEIALSTLIRGEKNVLWLPFLRSSDHSRSSAKKSASCTAGNSEKRLKETKNSPPTGANGSSQPSQQRQRDDAAAAAPHGGASPVGFLGVELQSMAFPNTTVTEYVIEDESGAKSVPAQTVVTADVTSLVAKMRPSELSRVQPMIAQCSSLKDAHAELRAQLSPVPIAGTVYVQIQSVELTSPEGQRQESQGGVAVEASFGNERGLSRKGGADLASGAARSGPRYSQIRLDIPDSVVSRRGGGRREESARESTGVPALELRLIGGKPRNTSATAGCGGGFGSSDAAVARSGQAFVYGGAGDASEATTESRYAGGENNINSYLKSPKRHSHHWGIKQPDEERAGQPSTMLITQQQHEQSQNHSSSTSAAHNGGDAGEASVRAAPKRTWRANSAFNDAAYYHNAQTTQQQRSHPPDTTEAESEKHYLGGANNLRSYVESSTQSNSRRQSPRRQDHRTQSEVYNNSSHRSRTASPSPAPGTATGVSHAAPYCGEIGLVRLSLRALLTTPLYKLGDTIRVPIVAPNMPASLSYRARHSPDVNQRCVVGHVTLRIALPAFEHIAESLRLGSRHVMSNIVPKYVHYYERRIGAYLRTHNAPDLVSFHYNLYERDVATGSWPVSLFDWMQALLKRHGPETANFGPEPPLPFDPEEWERARQRDESLRKERVAAIASSSRGDSLAASERALFSPRTSPSTEASPSRRKESARRRSKNSSKAAAEATYSF
ncbi:hypothetical protein ABB37_03839 [Leptomonas pyrrhocoris]|uniref:C2 domain-containing protein n=1 Tax=Leptomonas pyrrhocoris TaxID=157538 RepID=A0A0N0VFT8_LEPPY|nr:hypothetical protein ABB37_03839 [Leptomonas pyrrhocoris]KPA81482.1 hypothetical protein ABB37_03839 [Leptomonas pyrrhocoris]|eukprot:XP_015659921.1 hypothetical protein ABB37_03839 [Leptomonas pyrrhocoris]